MAGVRALHMGGGAIGDCQQLLYTGLAFSLFNLGVTLAQGLGDDTCHAFARGAGDSLRQTVCLGVFDVEAHR